MNKIEYEWRTRPDSSKYVPKDTRKSENKRELTNWRPECEGYVGYPNEFHSGFHVVITASDDGNMWAETDTTTCYTKDFDTKEEAIKWVEETLPKAIIEHYDDMIEAAEMFKEYNYPTEK